jgi:hypothetical protein
MAYGRHSKTTFGAQLPTHTQIRPLLKNDCIRASCILIFPISHERQVRLTTTAKRPDTSPSPKSSNLINTILPKAVHAPASGIREAIIPSTRVQRPVRIRDAEVVRAAARETELDAVGQREKAAVELARILAVGA